MNLLLIKMRIAQRNSTQRTSPKDSRDSKCHTHHIMLQQLVLFQVVDERLFDHDHDEVDCAPDYSGILHAMPKTNIGKTNKRCAYFVYVIVVARDHWFVKVAKVVGVEETEN